MPVIVATGGPASRETDAGSLFVRAEHREKVLLSRARDAAAGLLSLVFALGVHLPHLAVVGEIGLETFLDHAFLGPAVEHGKAQLDASEEIPPHPVGAGEVDVLLTAIQEVEDARVLEKPADD